MSVRVALVAVVVALPAVTLAKPLPAGTTATIKDGVVSITRAGTTVPIYNTDDDDGLASAVELSADATAFTISYTRCDFESATATVPVARFEARVENTLGMQAHVKKQYDAAITHFRAAMAKDPTVALYVTNLASAQAMANKSDDAFATIVEHAGDNLPWFAWRLHVDPELASVEADDAQGRIAPIPRGRAKYADVAAGFAYSPLGDGLFAAEVNGVSGGIGGVPEVAVAFVDAKTSRELLRLVVTPAISCSPTPDHCVDPHPGETKKQRAVVEYLLAQLGFDPIGKWPKLGLRPEHVTSADGKIVVDVKDLPDEGHGYELAITRGRATKSYTRAYGGRKRLVVGFAPQANALALLDDHGRCMDITPRQRLEIVALPAAPLPKVKCEQLEAKVIARVRVEAHTRAIDCMPARLGGDGYFFWVRGYGPHGFAWFFGGIRGDGSELARFGEQGDNPANLEDGVPTFEAADLDGDGVDEIVFRLETHRHSDAIRFGVLALRQGALVEILGPWVSYDSSGYEHDPASVCVGTIAIGHAGAKHPIVVTMTKVSDPEHLPCLALGKHTFTVSGDKLVETK